MIKLKLFLVLKKRNPSSKSVLEFVESELDRFLAKRGFSIVSYEVRED